MCDTLAGRRLHAGKRQKSHATSTEQSEPLRLRFHLALCGPVRFEQRLSPLSPLFISFIYLLILLFIQQTLPLFTQFEGGGTESFSENGQARRQVGVRISRSVRGGGALGGLHTHTHTSSSVRKSNHASGNTSICGSA